MKQLCAALLTGLLLVSLVRANEEAELTPTKNHNNPAAASLLSSGGSRHRLLMHKKSHRRHLLMDSSRNGLLGGSDDVELDIDDEIDDEIDDLGVDDKEAVDDDEEEEEDERLRQKRQKTNNKKKKNGSNNKKKNNNNNKKKKNGNNNKKRNGSGNNKNRKPSINKKKILIKQKLRNQEKIEEKQKDKKQELCLCEDLYGPDYWSTPSWNDYDDDWDSTTKRKQYKNVRNKKRINGRLLLLAEAEDEEEQEVLHPSFSGDDDVHQIRHLKADELIEHGNANEEDGDGTTSLAEDFEAAEKDEEEGSGGTMTLRFKRRQKRNNGNKKANRRNNDGRDKWRSSNSGKEDSWSWGDDEWSDDEWSDDEWGSDSWGSDSWGSDTWRKPKEKWCPCPYVPPEPTYAPTLSPSHSPTESPTLYPTQDPTRSPSMEPTLNPTPRPTRQPTPFPTRRPTPRPTPRPVTPGSPTKAPTSSPTKAQTSSPTKGSPATKAPSSSPTKAPSSPTKAPTSSPTKKGPPSATKAPSSSPSQIPSSQPSLQPSSQPSSSPSVSQMPSSQPSLQPSSQPSSSPSASQTPSSQPSLQPSTSKQPSSGPSANPSQVPSSQPSLQPSTSSQPSNQPSNMPSAPKATITDVDPLTPNDLNVDFQFGKSVAISGTSALIGAPNADVFIGVAYLFESLTGIADKLPLPDIPNGSECGASVALSIEYAVIGCPGFKESPTGNKIGAVFIYTRDSLNDPRQITYDDDDAAEFGTSVSVNAAGILAVGSNKGSVELFNLSNTPPSPIPITSTLGNNDFDTTSVALNDNWPPLLAVGAIKKAGYRSGSVFLYTDLLNSTAVPEEISTPTDANCASGCLFGVSVALSGNTLVVGSPETQSNAGRAFVYNDVVNFKDQVQPLPTPTESPPPANALFGSSVAIAGGAVVVGSPKYSIDGGINILGAAFFYNKNENGDWYAPDFDSISKEEQNPIVGGSHQEQFGKAVAISDDAFVVGAPFFSDFEGKAVAYSYTSATNP